MSGPPTTPPVIACYWLDRFSAIGSIVIVSLVLLR